MTSGAPWSIVKSDPNDQPPEHDPLQPWCVLHPAGSTAIQTIWTRKVTRFADWGNALAFVLAQPEVRRRTSSAGRALHRAAEALR